MSDTGILLNQRTNRTSKSDFHALYEFCMASEYSMAIWKEPGQDMYAIIDTGVTKTSEIDLESSEAGFLFHPYDASGDIHFIKAETLLKYDQNGLNWSEAPDLIQSEFEKFNSENSQMNGSTGMNFAALPVDKEQDTFMDLVESAKASIRSGKFHKVVPSRAKDLKLENFNLDLMIERLISKYKNAFISITYSPSIGLWIGASPEILVKTKDQIFKTVALAGTQPRTEGTELDEIAWTQKEIEEQAYVSRFIINCFKKIRLREFTEVGPKSIFSGNLIHLKTTFEVNMTEVNFPQLGTVMMQLLHPTSAVCGMPKEPAEKWLQSCEGYDREYFSGFLGPVNIDGDTALYVNLRCMKIMGSKARLYAGAGVTEDSKAAKEWLETEYKMNTLLDVIY